MKSAIVALVVMTAAALGGCATRNVGVLTTALPPARALDPGAPWQNGRFGSPSTLMLGERQVDVAELLPNRSGAVHVRTEQEFAAAVRDFEANADEQAKVQTRNRIVGQLVDASVTNCNVFLVNVRGSQIATRVTFDILTGGLSAAGGLASPERSAKLLSGLASFTNGAGSAFDRDIFAQTGVELVAKEIEGARKTARAAIEAKKKRPYRAWDLGSAMADVSSYHAMCSMTWGLARLQNVVAQNDLAVKAARTAAARVMAQGGTAQEVSAALTGVLDTQLESLKEDAAPADDLPDLDADVSALAANAPLCFDWGVELLVGEADDSKLPGNSLFAKECLPVGGAAPPWTDRFTKIVQDSLAEYAKLDATERARQAATFRVRVSKEGSGLGEIVRGRREWAWRASQSLGESGAKIGDAFTEIERICNTDRDDPALAAMLAAAKAAKETGATVVVMDAAARGSFQAYLETVKPPHLSHAPKPEHAEATAKTS